MTMLVLLVMACLIGVTVAVERNSQTTLPKATALRRLR